jgi:hypothetical protein
MAHPDAQDITLNTDLDAQFCHLSMSSLQLDPTNSSTNHPSLLSAQVPSSSSQFSAPASGSSHYLHLNDGITDDQQYPEDIAYPPYWSPDVGSVQAGPSSDSTADKPFQCPYEGCHKGYDRQCDLEYVMIPHKPTNSL